MRRTEQLICDSCDCPIMFDWDFHYVQILDVLDKVVQVIFCYACWQEEVGYA